MAHVAGILLSWDDFHELSAAVPLLAHVYPNGKADVNQFGPPAAAGGDPRPAGAGVAARRRHHGGRPGHGGLHARAGAARRRADTDRRPRGNAGRQHRARRRRALRARRRHQVLVGELGRAVIKTSAVKPEHRWWRRRRSSSRAGTTCWQRSSAASWARFRRRAAWRGPAACGMPELHKLTPTLTLLQERGFRVAMVTDGRMSGASGRCQPPSMSAQGDLRRRHRQVRDGDIVRVDAPAGTLTVKVPPDEWAARELRRPDTEANRHGVGRDLFATFRRRSAARRPVPARCSRRKTGTLESTDGADGAAAGNGQKLWLMPAPLAAWRWERGGCGGSWRHRTAWCGQRIVEAGRHMVGGTRLAVALEIARGGHFQRGRAEAPVRTSVAALRCAPASPGSAGWPRRAVSGCTGGHQLEGAAQVGEPANHVLSAAALRSAATMADQGPAS